MILTRLGEFKLNDDEGFVERLGNAIFRLYEDNHEILLGNKAKNTVYDLLLDEQDEDEPKQDFTVGETIDFESVLKKQVNTTDNEIGEYEHSRLGIRNN